MMTNHQWGVMTATNTLRTESSHTIILKLRHTTGKWSNPTSSTISKKKKLKDKY